MRKAARMKDAGERSDVEAGMAMLLASETGKELVSTPCASTAATATGGVRDRRLYRDAPLR
jgi:hypothetical protein